MNYRHAYHAGNFADVLKHTALVSCLLHLHKKDKPFVVIDTHAGRGAYDIAGEEAVKTSEAKNGILRLLAAGSMPEALQRYCDLVRRFGEGVYPGSPLIAATLIREDDRLVAIEKHAEEFAALKSALARFPRVRLIEGDGYRELKGLLPPPERRGLVLIDPPYEDDADFMLAAQAIAEAHRRFATGIYLWWYPLKSRAFSDAATGEVLNAGVRKVLRAELDVGTPTAPPKEGRGPALSATGLLIINPPFGFEEEIGAALPYLAEKLAQGPGAKFRLERLA